MCIAPCFCVFLCLFQVTPLSLQYHSPTLLHHYVHQIISYTQTALVYCLVYDHYRKTLSSKSYPDFGSFGIVPDPLCTVTTLGGRWDGLEDTLLPAVDVYVRSEFLPSGTCKTVDRVGKDLPDDGWEWCV